MKFLESDHNGNVIGYLDGIHIVRTGVNNYTIGTNNHNYSVGDRHNLTIGYLITQPGTILYINKLDNSELNYLNFGKTMLNMEVQPTVIGRFWPMDYSLPADERGIKPENIFRENIESENRYRIATHAGAPLMSFELLMEKLLKERSEIYYKSLNDKERFMIRRMFEEVKYETK